MSELWWDTTRSAVVWGRDKGDIMISFVVWTKTNETATNMFRQLSGTRWDTKFTAEVWKPVSTGGTPRGFFNFFNFFSVVNFVRGIRVVTQRAQGGIYSPRVWSGQDWANTQTNAFRQVVELWWDTTLSAVVWGS